MEVEFCGCANYTKVCQVCQEVNIVNRDRISIKAYLKGVVRRLIELERAFDAPVSREAMCASQRALP